MNFNAVIPEFIVSNIEQSRSFYCDLLGFTIEYGRPEENFLFLSLEDCQLMIEEGTKEELAELTYPFGRGVNISFGIKDVPRLYQKLLESNYPIHRPLTKREFRVGEQYIYPHEFAVLDPDGYFLRFSEQNNHHPSMSYNQKSIIWGAVQQRVIYLSFILKNETD